MAMKKKAPTENLRRCIGSVKFGIEAHEAPVGEFPVQPSQKDGLGRMCKPHWNQYTAGLARDRKAKAGGSDPTKPTKPTGWIKGASSRLVCRGGRLMSETAANAALRKKVRAGAKPAKKPEPIRTKAPRQKSSGEKIAESMAEAAAVREGDTA